MAAGRRWRVVRFALAADPRFDERLRGEPGIELTVAPAPKSPEDVAAALKDADVYHVASARNEMSKYTFVTSDFVARFPRLLAVSTYGAGYDSVDVESCTRAGIAVVSQMGANRDSVAEHTLGLLLSVVHRIAEQDRRMRAEKLTRREDLMGREVKGMTLGLVGIGQVGTRVAEIAHVFGMTAIAVDPFVEPDEIRRRGAVPTTLDELVSRSDIVSLHCPRDKTTIGMFGAARFAAMKRGAYFVTTARGGIHDERALAEALSSGHLAGAGVDVWEPEPPALDNPLLKLPNVIASFHTAGVTHEARRNIATMGSDQIVRMLRGERPPRLVNPEVWETFRARWQAIKAK
jgi:D-3-phosphoglycerate dehydrogenase / 2-oxoglutarate reductase